MKNLRAYFRRNGKPKLHGSSRRRASLRLTSELLEDRRVLASWVPSGPAPILNGQTANALPNNQVSGAIHSVVAHPTDVDTLYIGAVNGGIWSTNNATATNPTWTPLTDHLQSLSIGDLEMDPTDPNTLLAGVGRPSAFGGQGGALTGLQLTRDGGATWTELTDPLLVGREFAGVTIRGDLILAASNGGFTELRDSAAAFGVRAGGLFRSSDGGGTFTSIEIFPRDSARPNEPIEFNAFDIVADPTNPQRYYMGIQDEGLFRSVDGGVTWTEINDGAITQAITTTQVGLDDMGVAIREPAAVGSNNNIELSVANDGRLFAGILENSQVEYIGYSDDQGSSWTRMDLPFTPDIEDGNLVGLQPRLKPGAQGFIHFSLKVDPNDSDIVYIGGDRQAGEVVFPNGNSIGATSSVGRLFRGDVTVEPLDLDFNPTLDLPIDLDMATFGDLLEFVSPQWEHLTHANNVIFAPGGGTANNSAPHADSRGFAFDVNGDLIQVDDGGIFRRTNPRSNMGDWFSLAGNLQVAEMHNIAYDSNSNILIGGTQDNSTVQQVSSGSNQWALVVLPFDAIDFNNPFRSGGDGGDVAVDDTSRPGFSIRYSSAQNLGLFRRQVFDANNVLVEQTLINSLDAIPEEDKFFVTPLALNNVDATRIAVATRQGLLVSADQGDNFVFVAGTNPNNPIGPIFRTPEDQNALVFGGTRYGNDNVLLTYWAVGNEILIRSGEDTIGGVAQNLTIAQLPGSDIRDIAADDNNYRDLYAIDDDSVFVTTNFGTSWANITGNLPLEETDALRSLRFVPGANGGAVVLGTNRGVYISRTHQLGTWERLGDNELPHAPVFDIDYDATDDLLVVSLLGRGAWTLNNVGRDFTDRAAAASQPNGTVSGVIWNDANQDRVRSAGEAGVPGIRVYVDSNQNGRFDTGESTAFTSATGSYLLPATSRNVFGTAEVRIEVPNGATQTNQEASGEAEVTIFSTSIVTGVNFGVNGVSTGGGGDGGGGDGGGGDGGGGDGGDGGGGSGGGGTIGNGVITGTIFNDLDADGMQDEGEAGIAGATVYLDANDNCIIGLGEYAFSTNSQGEFRFEGLVSGTYRVRMAPIAGYEHEPCGAATIMVGSDGVASAVAQMGVSNRQVDLGLDGSASHRIVEGFQLGATVVADPDNGVDDNDGVVFLTGLQPGRTETILVSVQQLSVSPAFLQGWIDFNGDGDWNDAGERIFRNQRVADGVQELPVQVPAGASGTNVRSRFRWGFELDLGPFADSMGGEVEDYIVSIPSAGSSGIVAADDVATIGGTEDSITIPVLENDRAGILGGALTITTVSSTSLGGTAVIDGEAITYTPPADFIGPDTFTYTVTDGRGGQATATVTVNASFPIALDDSFMTIINGADLSLNVLANDLSSPTGSDGLTIVGVTMPSGAGGTVQVAANGLSLVYSPPASMAGTDTFTYTVEDSMGRRAMATVMVEVADLDPLARISLRVTDIAGNDVTRATLGQELQLRAFTSDLREVPLGLFSAYIDVMIDNGSLINLGGPIVFGDTIPAGGGTRQTYTISTSGTISTNLIDEVGAVDGVINPPGSDPAFPPLGGGDFLLFTLPFTAGQSSGIVSFNPDPADNLPANQITLYGASSAVPAPLVQLVGDTLEISDIGAVNDFVTIAEDTIGTVMVLANDRPETGMFTIIPAPGTLMPANGTATIVGDSIRYVPNPNFFGTDSFTYTVRDESTPPQEFTATVTVIVTPVNDPPTAGDDTGVNGFTVERDASMVSLDVMRNDSIAPDEDETISVTAVDPIGSANGLLSVAPDGQSVIYTPAPGFSGIETFRYTITDSNGGVDTALVEVTVEITQRASVIFNIVDAAGQPIEQIGVGSPFFVEVLVQSLLVDSGVFSAYLDTFYDSNLATLDAITYGDLYPSAQKGNDSVAGFIDELGAVDGLGSPTFPNPSLLATLQFTSTGNGVFTINGDPADDLPANQMTLFGVATAVAPDEQTFIADTLTIGTPPASSFTNLANPNDVNGDTYVSPLDALLVINELDSGGARPLADSGGVRYPLSYGSAAATSPVYMVDVNGDGVLSPLDALLVINALSQPSGPPASALSAAAGSVSSAGPAQTQGVSGEIASAIDFVFQEMERDDDETEAVGLERLSWIFAE